jgi:hypothetical protein
VVDVERLEAERCAARRERLAAHGGLEMAGLPLGRVAGRGRRRRRGCDEAVEPAARETQPHDDSLLSSPKKRLRAAAASLAR